jgi:AraC-like DNA-binding protein
VHTENIHRGKLLTLEIIECNSDARKWQQIEAHSNFGVVAPRRGVFKRRVKGDEVVVDARTIYFDKRELEQEVAHTAHGSHEGLIITLCSRLAEELGSHPAWVRHMDAQQDLTLRRVTAQLRAGTAAPLEAEETVVSLIATLMEPPNEVEITGIRHATRRARQQLVADTREALAVDPMLSLSDLASHVGASPAYLSRVFHQSTGETLSRWRNQIRVLMALDRLESGEQNLARLAADVGFFDHAHMTRVMRAQVGAAPSAVREQLAAKPQPKSTISRFMH